MPVPADHLVPLGGLDCLLGAVVGPVDGELGGEQPDLFLVVAQPAAERIAGVVAVVPVPVPVVGDAEGDGFVVALAELGQLLGVQGRVPSGQGFLDAVAGFAEDLDDVGGPGLQAAGAELGDRAGAADDVLVIPISG